MERSAVQGFFLWNLSACVYSLRREEVSMNLRIWIFAIGMLAASRCSELLAQEKTQLAVTEGDFVAHDFQFKSGEKLAELRLHYRTLGKPVRDANGHVTNAVMILHGTGGSGAQFLSQQFADELFGAGQLLDTNRYFVILPD